MIDTIKLKQRITAPLEAIDRIERPIKWEGYKFYPRWGRLGKVSYYYARLDNLRMTLSPDGWFKIENSLHKFFKGNNHTDFTHTEVIEAVEMMPNSLPIDGEQAIIQSIDIGVNIQTETMPEALRWKGYLKNPANKYNTGRQISTSDFSIKVYDKIDELKNRTRNDRHVLPGPLSRVELSINRMRSIQNKAKPIPLFRLTDLCRKDVFNALADLLLSKYQKVSKGHDWNYPQLSLSDVKLVRLMEDDVYINFLQNHNKYTWKDCRKKYNRLLHNLQPSNFELTLKQKLDDLKC